MTGSDLLNSIQCSFQKLTEIYFTEYIVTSVTADCTSNRSTVEKTDESYSKKLIKKFRLAGLLDFVVVPISLFYVKADFFYIGIMMLKNSNKSRVNLKLRTRIELAIELNVQLNYNFSISDNNSPIN